MTIASTATSVSYVGTGLLSAYPFDFPVLAAGDLAVLRTLVGEAEELLVEGTDYTVALNTLTPGGVVNLSLPLALSADLVIRRVLAALQPANLRNQGAFFPEVHETAFDRLTMLVQQNLLVARVDGRVLFDAQGVGILNLPLASTPSEPVTLQHVTSLLLTAGLGLYRTIVDGWYQENAVASQSAVPLARLATTTFVATRWIALQLGSLVGVCVKSSAPRTAGSLTVQVFKNGALFGALAAVLDAAHPSFHAAIQAPYLDAYAAGDELELRVTTDSAWLPITADVRAALEVSTAFGPAGVGD